MRRVLLVYSFLLFFYNIQFVVTSKTDLLRQQKFPPCRACRTFINSFKRGIEKTAKGKFEGGDTAWEEEKLGNYATSEIRLVEIQEKVCADVEEGRDQCYSLHEEYDGMIETWWFNHQSDEPDLFKYFCIDKLKYCCPDFHYGPNCTECAGYPDNICSNNGKCKGAGTRKGNGQCSCNLGYAGQFCDTCAEGYFHSYQDSKKILCSKCHDSCDGPCKSAGPTGCEKCAKGWLMDSKKGCIDVNECAAPKSVCTALQFCVNTDGSYRCLDCDRSCAGCTGDGPDMCIKCAKGYKLVNNMCVDAEQENRKQHVFLTRYLTYLGLCIATCIIFQRSIALAAVIGLAVAIYISVSEYMLNTPLTPNTTEFAERLMKAKN